MTAFASLPMYDWPELRPSVDAFWVALRARLRAEGFAPPPRLERERPSAELWRDDALVFSQCCGADLVAGLRDRLAPVAAPSYAARGCALGRYSSVIVTRRGAEPDALPELAAARIAVNGYGSFSGWWALGALPLRPTRRLITGAHRLSARAVAACDADFAALDAVVFALLQRVEPETADALSVVAETPLAPAPPFVIRAGGDVAAARRALGAALAEAPEAAEAMLLSGIEPCAVEDYTPLLGLKPGEAAASPDRP